MRMGLLIAEDEKGQFYIKTAKGDFVAIGADAVKDIDGHRKTMAALVETGGKVNDDLTLERAWLMRPNMIPKRKRFSSGTPEVVAAIKERAKALRERLEALDDLTDGELRDLIPAEGLLIKGGKLSRKEMIASIRGARIARVELDKAKETDGLGEKTLKALRAIVVDEDYDIDLEIDRLKMIAGIRAARLEDDDDGEKTLEEHTVEELKALIEKEELDVDGKSGFFRRDMKKAELIEAIKEARPVSSGNEDE